jgi:predicted O-methyltransferase YrrM
MSLLNKFKIVFEAFYQIARNPSLLIKITSDNSVWTKKLLQKYPNYNNGFPAVDLLCLTDNFNETVETFSFLGGGSMPTDIILLQILAKKFNNCTYFEIGTWRGESIINVSNYAKTSYTFNLPKKEILKFKLGEKYANLHGIFSKTNSKIIHLEGNSFNYDFSKLNKTFDLIFVDGDHSYQGVKNDTEKIFKHLIHENSIIVWHDYAFNPEMLRFEVILAILDGTPNELKKHLYYVSNSMCAIFYQKPIESYKYESPIIPDKVFSLKIISKKFNNELFS